MSDSWTGAEAGVGRVGAVEYVLRDLRDAIRAGIFPIDSRLPSESALSARYSVSRAVVREALRACEAHGLTTTRNGVGTFVIAENSTSVVVFGDFLAVHLIEARPHIEVPAAGFAALRRSDGQLAGLVDIVEAMESEAHPERWVALDTSLHLAIAEASGNPVFTSMQKSIRDALTSQSSLLNSRGARRADSDVEHRAIVSAIARGSAVEAEDAMQYHLDQVKDAVTSATLHSTTDEGDGNVRHDKTGNRSAKA